MDLKETVQKARYYDELVGSINIAKIAQDRIEYGYDSICLRVNELVAELAFEKSKDKDSFHYGDLNYWKQWYGKRACRIFDILDDLLENKGHSKPNK